MNDTEILNHILDYLDEYEQILNAEWLNASNDVRFIVAAKCSTISEVIDYIENTLGIAVRRPYYEPFGDWMWDKQLLTLCKMGYNLWR